MRIAMLVPAPDYPAPFDWAFDVQAEALRAAGAEVEGVPWTELGDVSRFDLVLPLVAWGYNLQYDRWLAFLERADVERWPLINPADLLRWSSNKAYLADLADAGVSTVPTLAVESCCQADLAKARARFGCDRLVIKPPISAAASGTYRVGPDDVLPADSRGKPTIVQPLIEQIATQGEFSLMLFDGEFSHSVVKHPAPGDFRVQPHLGGTAAACAPPPGGIDLAKAALAAAPTRATYARVDMVPDASDRLMIMEMELVEPALFLNHAPGSKAAFARAILSVVKSVRE